LALLKEENMVSALLRIARVLVAQGLGYIASLAIPIPYLGITVGAVVNGVFKFLRDKFPTATWLVWLPL
jgi:hypothetical protein